MSKTNAKRKRLIILLIIAVIIMGFILIKIIIASIIDGPPKDPNVMWVCEEEELYFYGWDNEKSCRYGELKIAGDTIPIRADFMAHYPGMVISCYDEYLTINEGEEFVKIQEEDFQATPTIFFADCTFTPFRISADITDGYQNIFGDGTETLHFTRKKVK